ncbi:hypothetical protein [Flavobacterium phage V157]|uniref:Uncharacterized protein n=20 Tax=Ficleduovirus TaxID=2560131 RepID=A0A0A0YUV5_9CAUD|nr:hypothetical protein ABG42_gp05 [Flavobacterium phage FCL-2]YP_009591091.1 hypothetical protein FDG55_gp05 [Flavobacterium phage FCV-1]ASD51589.1 hypothetical protein [Flavobacterium phage FCV-3]ASD51663.1 hypothetical protein [Flavobacterium phage FCV-11]ASD51737.1 hypothetical protein [Flavobacterium phage V175]ASD51815.1 hypothetical protein [Flavobacterium phage V181]ASD52493.1 hypothetical protein [Flavobacterium phage FCV-10]ASD52566.1 hypothetical protein [Flavobacterium phage FCV-
MKKLKFSIDKIENTVTFTFFGEKKTSTLIHISKINCTHEEFYQNLVDRCVTVEKDTQIINSENKLFNHEELVFKDKNGSPLISILLKNIPLTEEEKEELEDEYQEAVFDGRNDAKNWRELYRKTTGYNSPKNSI